MAPFFEDCYRRISVREYAKLVHVSPPTASKLLKRYAEGGLLLSKAEFGRLLFWLNREHPDVVQLTRLYWSRSLAKVVEQLRNALVDPTIVLFGSAAKAELTNGSDIDIAVFAGVKRAQRLPAVGRVSGHEISLHVFPSLRSVPKELRENIFNGQVLFGRLRWE
jgi:predicted nucleotidyltransferase